MNTKHIKAGVCAGIPLLLVLWNPLALAPYQNLLFGMILLGITLWATELVDRTLVSVALLLVFTAISGVSMERIFSFPLSANFLTIVSSFLLSAGVVSSGVAKQLADERLSRQCSSLV